MQGVNGALGKPTSSSRLKVGRRCFRLQRKACRLRPDKILCSDLKRCQLLAEAIAARLGLFAEPDPIWREVSFGTWENRTWSDIQAREPHVLSEWITNFDTVAPPDGESFEQLQARVLTGVKGKIVGPKCDTGVPPEPQARLNTGETPRYIILLLPMPVLSVRQSPPFPAYPFGRHLSWRYRTAVIPAFVGRTPVSPVRTLPNSLGSPHQDPVAK